MLIPIIASCGGNDETTTTEIPTTEIPTNEIPTTEAPTTEIPTTEAPTTEISTTESPTTEIPTTEAPTTNNNDNIDNVENPWDSIYISVNKYWVPDSRFNYKNTVNISPERLDDSENVPSQLTININGEDILLDYVDSCYHQVLETFIDGYYSEKGGYYVDLYKDGTIFSVVGGEGFASVEIPKNATLEEALPFAKEFLNQFTDLSQYNSTNHKKDSDSGVYSFEFYNDVNGYIANWSIVVISADGKVTRMRIDKMQNEITSLNIDKEKTEELLLKKIKDIYTTDFVEFVSCEANSEYDQVRIIKDKIYLFHEYNIKFKLKGESIEYHTTQTFLVPYELVKAE